MRSELWLTEGIRMKAICRDPSELITQLCLKNVNASDFRETGNDEYSFYVPFGTTSRVIGIGHRCGAEITIQHRRGFFHFLRRFRKRAYLLLIPLPFLLYFLILSTHIWQIDVCGNETISRGEILTALESYGVYCGVSGLHLDNPQIRSRMQEALDRLIWCTVQVHGSRALVEIRERREPPVVVDESLPREVAAAKTGTVESIGVLAGKPLVKRGDTVLCGQTLITGSLSDRQAETRYVHAMGRVMAWTWYENALTIPLSVEEKTYTGDVKRLYQLKIGELQLNFYNDSSISRDSYDKITTEKRAEIFGMSLPVSLRQTEYRAYRLSLLELDPEACAGLLEDRLLRWLHRAAPDAEVLETWFQREVKDGYLQVRLLAQCREDIAAEREIGAR